MPVLVIGFGNPSRRDDGVGLAVVNGLRRRLGVAELDEGADGFDELGRPLDTLFLQQLGPELAETIAGYEHLYLVDANAGTHAELVHAEQLQAVPSSSLVSHHMKPGLLLALALQMYGAAPATGLISVRGFDFDFGLGMSPATRSGVEVVIDDLWQRHGQ